jgi:hypothetical protein
MLNLAGSTSAAGPTLSSATQPKFKAESPSVHILTVCRRAVLLGLRDFGRPCPFTAKFFR